MSYMKQYAEEVSCELGYQGELNDEVLAEAQARIDIAGDKLRTGGYERIATRLDKQFGATSGAVAARLAETRPIELQWNCARCNLRNPTYGYIRNEFDGLHDLLTTVRVHGWPVCANCGGQLIDNEVY